MLHGYFNEVDRRWLSHLNILVVVDMQKGFINKNNEFLIKNIAKIVKLDKFDKIIATQFVNYKDSQYERFLQWTAIKSSPEVDLAVNLPKGTEVLQKTSYALPSEIFSGGGIKQGDKVYLCGTDYEACVLAIAYQLFDRGTQVHKITDGVGSSARVPVSTEILDKIVSRNFGSGCLIDSSSI